ncbi:MAG: epoxide hydrolase 1 [Clostridiales Family XIII bacterium]|jgi:microsomal epoxide hydrolase|nr:epoxide hydrolase 1 [Clostridiales Family XIII bacterium]
MSIEEYVIDVPRSVLADLRFRLEHTRWPSKINGAEWQYGTNLEYLEAFCAYWRDGYDWRKQEAALNKWPQYMCRVDGVDIHFWHIKGHGGAPFPLLLLHGWPGSAYEFFEMIGPLTDPAAYGGREEDAFDVVLPDLPGYGWSGKPTESGWGAARIARALNKLMTEELGYRRYGTQGGDWGAMISARLGALFPEHVAAIHLNFAFLPVPMLNRLPAEDMAMVERQQAFDQAEGAYHMIQETKCDSLTVAQTDSPAGFAAWVLEKFRTWSDCGGNLESVYSKDRLITNLMFYWAPGSIASAARLYYESLHDPETNLGAPDPQIPVPAAVARFPCDPFNRPRSWMEKHFNVVRWTEMPAGGHFAAWEQPVLLCTDVREFYRGIRAEVLENY